MLNVHPSLLPKYPGLHTYRRALEAGDSEHGSTVHFVIPELDAGPGILQYRVASSPATPKTSLRARVQQGEYLIYPRAIAWFAAGRLALKDGSTWLDGERLSAPVIVEETRNRRRRVATSRRAGPGTCRRDPYEVSQASSDSKNSICATPSLA